MDLRHLTIVRELADRGSVGAVAAALHVTPSAISQQLRVAERELGMPIVEPAGRGVRLTEAGRLLADGAVDVATAVAAVQSRLDAYRGSVGGTVDIAVLPSAGVVLLPGLLRCLAESPIEVRIHDRDVAEAAYADLARDHDLVIGHRLGAEPHREWRGLTHVDLLREPIDVAMPTGHPLATRRAVTAADLVGERWIGVPTGYPFDDVRIAIEQQAGTPFTIVQRLRDNQLIAALVDAGHGLALLPRLSSAAVDGVVLRPLRGLQAGRTITALARRDVAQRALVRHVLDALSDAAAAVGAVGGAVDGDAVDGGAEDGDAVDDDAVG